MICLKSAKVDESKSNQELIILKYPLDKSVIDENWFVIDVRIWIGI
jgi:hypothetical protein